MNSNPFKIPGTDNDTIFSTYMQESLILLQKAQYGLFLFYVVGSNVMLTQMHFIRFETKKLIISTNNKQLSFLIKK